MLVRHTILEFVLVNTRCHRKENLAGRANDVSIVLVVPHITNDLAARSGRPKAHAALGTGVIYINKETLLHGQQVGYDLFRQLVLLKAGNHSR